MVVSEFYFGLGNVEVEARIKKKGADLPSSSGRAEDGRYRIGAGGDLRQAASGQSRRASIAAMTA